uniref:EF-hand domain-containing protein n=2 Tax=Choreotrichia TaxID=141411 RepID=A0A7S3MIS5_9SPIT|mmetsp:Transcript_9506/g.12951  ORF Transcript_9506/g.12951 Transcript_9506/m.12951 type:complete len:125 (-) Transcript_9506:436-810(-)|eukprot:CAMPEP_0185579002 /NCGR_PEP_ID=MMETSP0434-20130131/13283_1 /TAXON_ID=626734 ORGANISM="Favella taraikaensis, Strain Fe Narragansett Bay" /NCGR_SAMPLE_ID=MMETSP0434 /ASSEMBLY_ACC=CAM_ASM_000379 /LENGTH=124 /DNA_ID=CAMNT_0028196941 /DNA_START=26 /DNA_END=400 /DNA_ORIENTATION=-
MINTNDFAAGELEAALTKLQSFQSDEAQLSEEVQKYFSAYDTDDNAHLDRRELRQFLSDFFSQYHIRVPITDEYVDAVFRSIDKNHDNKIQPEELIAFAKVFVGSLVQEFTGAAACASEEQKQE